MKQPKEILYCEHVAVDLDDNIARPYTILGVGEKQLAICRACYGELMVQIIEDLKTIKIEPIRPY